MHRFFIPPEWIEGEQVRFQDATAHQMRQVLRLREGQRVMALDNQGLAYEVELNQVSAQGVGGRVVWVGAAEGEPKARVALFLGLTQREKFEWMLQKCTELGAAAFIPVITSRSLVQDRDGVEKKLDRWRRILQEASEQCGRGRVPVLYPAVQFEAAVREAHAPRYLGGQPGHLALIPWEAEHGHSLQDALSGLVSMEIPRVSLLIGPEGGFSEAEVETARAAGVQPVTLGKRILRAETAAMAAAALTMFILGEMD